MRSERALVRRAVEVVRGATCAAEYEPVWRLLEQVARDGPVALRLGSELLASDDPDERATGCDLLGEAAALHEGQREAAAAALLALSGSERDGGVLCSIAGALGKTADPRAGPVLAGLAGHADPDVRFQVALSVPMAWSGDPGGADVLALTSLTADPDDEVRDWATFGLGTMLAEADTEQIRAALWNRTSDEHARAREEGICGLARRRDPRAAGLMAGLLADSDGVHVLVFGAAAVLGAPELLAWLENYDPEDPLVAEALAACDPAARDRRDVFAWELLCALYCQQPGIDAALCSRRHEAGIELTVTAGDTTLTWSADRLGDRAGADPQQAAALVLSDLREHQRAAGQGPPFLDAAAERLVQPSPGSLPSRYFI